MPGNKVQNTEQFSTFYVCDRLYGLDVTRVQEIVRDMQTTGIPLAPAYVRGLINLRGQVATAIGLRELFSLPKDETSEVLNVVCKIEGFLISFQVDKIGDVMEVQSSDFEPTPNTIPESTRRFLAGVYKVSSQLLSIIDIDKVMFYLNEQNNNDKAA
ncbi:chemotaxis protein CheW [Pseudobacteriovorax antillogorgiicola]|uniref:Purine-binding chemotaxis protein CheW n=1 Tax=Pseudobacteriovorax antillogorgiicola TaxID=1513793 RepID=A0A1Y6BV26_9BACT|nr:chemotaxis protein CheW [Pseudobacteriovorax antillogorgiicola]TCS52368.1 purine-binding chemotaxis protein CheW [Pseudobacteriovorax antillogorgiicola]SMF29398.1 purine-binding chemotaxis protein CheW [Pseudobacteriovorax antillogorgiicola]